MTSLRNEGYVSWEIGKQLLLQPSKNVKENDWLPRKKLFVFLFVLNGKVQREAATTVFFIALKFQNDSL